MGTTTGNDYGLDADGGGDELDTSGYVRRARRIADLSQRDLAVRTGVTQSQIARIENGADVGVETFARLLAVAGLRIAILDEEGSTAAPMPRDVLCDAAGRRRPAHLDVHAVPERPSLPMLFRYAVPPRPEWHHNRTERDRLRRMSGADGGAEQLTRSALVERRRFRRR